MEDIYIPETTPSLSTCQKNKTTIKEINRRKQVIY
jgi:hypothetical protein